MINQRLRAKLIITLLMIASLSALTVYGLPVLLKSKILTLIQQETGRKASLANVWFSLLPLSIQLQNLAIQESNDKPFASFAGLYVSVSVWQSLTHATLVIDKIALQNPVVRLVKQKDGKFNIDSLFKPQPDKQQGSSVFPITINSLSFSDGTLTWEDPSSKETIKPINLTVENFTTTANEKCQLTLQLALASGGQLNWQGEASLDPLLSTGHIEVNQLKLSRLLPELGGHELFSTDYKASYANQQFSFTATKAKLELRDFQYTEKNQDAIAIKAANFSHETDIKISYAKDAWLFAANKSNINLRDFEFSGFKTPIKIATLSHRTDFKMVYAHDNWQFSLNNSKIDAHDLELGYLNAVLKIPELALETSLDTRLADNSVQVTTQQGKLNSHQIQLLEKTRDKPLMTMPVLALDGVDFNLDKQALTINSVSADGADFHTVLNPKGLLNYQTLFATTRTEEKPTATATPSAPSTPWAINIKQISLTQFGTSFTDQTQKPPVVLTIKPISFKLSDYSNKAGVKLPVQLEAGIDKKGNIQIDGSTTLEPFSAQLAINAKAIELEPFQPYLEKFARLDIIDGQFASTGKLAISVPENKPLALTFTGDSSISQLVTRDQKLHKDFIKWKTLTLKALSVDLQKDRYTADTLVIDKPYAKVTIKKDKTINFSDVFITEPQAGKVAAKTATQQQPYFKLNRVQIIDGSSDFADNSLILPFAAEIKSLDGGASDISSNQKSTIKVSLKGNAYDLAPVDIDGNIKPYLGNYDLTLNFRGMPMPLISPYMVEFAGYKVEKGKMSLKLKYKVVDGELTVSNNILIDQFELGEKVENPKAVSLPLEMAVALLKDSDGKMTIDVPITGSLNNPQFNIGAIIRDALVNAIGKVITSPFRALASLADSDADLSTINFDAGSAVLNKTELEKLTVLAKLLKERPVLVLDIKGTAFQAQDWRAVREPALYDLLKKMKADEINQQEGSKKILPAYVELSYNDYKRLIADLFIAKFPNLAKKSLLGKPELIDDKMGEFYEVAKQQLAASLKQEPPRLKDLATQRAQAIASYLVQKGGVSHEQIFILDPVVDPKRDNNEIASVLSLKAN